MTTQEIEEVIKQNDKPERAKLPGMVYQVWEDGEITLQKSGKLLWQRGLHCIQWGLEKSIPLECFPEYGREKEHAYIFTDEEGAEVVRAAIAQM